MNKMWRRFISLILIVSITTVSCMTNQAIRPPQSAPNVLKPGDNVRIVTKDSMAHIFKIKEITSDAIVGENIRVEFNQIAGLWKRKFSLWKTVGLVGILTAAALVVTAAIYFSTHPLFPKGWGGL